MPQDKRRSFSYRSFFTCDDPSGIECGAIRKSKINAQRRVQDISKVEPYRNAGNNSQKTCVDRSVVKETKEPKETTVTFKLLEVSEEVDKLNHVIKYWSNGNKFKAGNQNNNIAKDLLKGALDLQESLVMLGKMQEGSSFMLGSPKRQKQKLEEGTFDGMVNGVRGFERSVMALNGRYGRKSVDETRNVVRDRLLGQDVMMTNPVFEEHYNDHKKIVSPDVMPSTSSSQSSMVYLSNFVPSDPSVSSSTLSQRKKGEDSNLIVKHMDLNSFPSSPSRNVQKEKNLNLAKFTNDNDLLRAKRLQFGAQEMGMKQRSVEDILKNLKFKGLPRNSLVNGLKMNSLESEVFSPKNSWGDENPPIVVMKPISYPCLDLGGPYMPNFRGDDVMMKQHNRGPAQETARNEALNFIEKYEVPKGSDSEEHLKSNKKDTSSKVKASVNPQQKLQKKQIEVKKASEIEKVTSTRRKGEEENDAKSRDHLSSRDQEKCATLNTRRQKDGKPISSQQKMASPFMLDHQKSTSELEKNREPALVVEEKHICKGDKKESDVIYKEKSDSKAVGNLVFPTVNSITADNDDIERCQIPFRVYDIDSQKKLLDTSEEIPYLRSDKKSPHYEDNRSSYSQLTSVSTTEYYGIDQLSEAESSLREVTLVTTHENGIAVHHDTYWEGTESVQRFISSPERNNDDSLRQCVTPRTKLKALILSSILCVNHIEEHFNIQVNPDEIPYVIDVDDQDLESPKLLIDCAKEVLDLKTFQLLQACSPCPVTYARTSQRYPSLDFLLEEVCNGIEDLRCYSRQLSDNFPCDNLYVLLDRDLRLKSGIWGVSWRSLYTQDEVEQIVCEVDSFVLNNLIEEALLYFLK